MDRSTAIGASLRLGSRRSHPESPHEIKASAARAMALGVQRARAMKSFPRVSSPVVVRVLSYTGLMHLDVEFEGTGLRGRLPTALVPEEHRALGSRFELAFSIRACGANALPPPDLEFDPSTPQALS